MDDDQLNAILDRQEKFSLDMLKMFQDSFEGLRQDVQAVTAELKSLKASTEAKFDVLHLQQEATHRTLLDLTQEVERIADKIDFDGVTYDTRVILETDPTSGFTTIRRYRNAA